MKKSYEVVGRDVTMKVIDVALAGLPLSFGTMARKHRYFITYLAIKGKIISYESTVLVV